MEKKQLCLAALNFPTLHMNGSSNLKAAGSREPGSLKQLLLTLEGEILNVESVLRKILSKHTTFDSTVGRNVNINMGLQSKLFDADADDEELLQHFFDKIDTDHDALITMKEIDEILAKDPDQLGFVESLKVVLCDLNDDCTLDFQAFKAAAQQVPRVKGQRVSWVASLGLDGALAQYLKIGEFSDPMKGIKEMTDVEVHAACLKFFERDLFRMIKTARDGLKTIEDEKLPDVDAVNQKFSGTAGAMVASFATLDDFQKGPEGILGCPNPKLMDGMEIEHTLRPSSRILFLTPNYGLVTRSEWEWHYSVHGDTKNPPTDLKERFLKNGGKYPGETGEVLSELEVHCTIALDTKPVEPKRAADIVEEMRRRLTSPNDLLQSEEDILRGLTLLKSAEVDRDRQVEFSFTLPLPLEAQIDSAVKSRVQQLICSAAGLDTKRVTITFFQERISEFCDFLDEKSFTSGLSVAPVAELERRMTICDYTPRPDDCRLPLGVSSLQEFSEALQRKRQALESARIHLPRIGQDRLVSTRMGSIGLKLEESESESLRLFAKELCKAFEEQTRLWRLCHLIRKQGRTRQPNLHEFILKLKSNPETCDRLDQAKLRMEEILALSMYTGPLYVLYNAVLRGFPAVLVKLLNTGHTEPADKTSPVYGNRFETTLFVICSGITKLSRFTRVPPNRLLYRGLGGVLLPQQFWKDTKGMDYKGGVEFGLMSTTTDRSIAVQYSGTRVKRGIVFEISAGRVDIGASISFLSQYSREEEFLVVGHPRVEQTQHGQIITFPLRLSVNQKGIIVEQLIERRKALHISMAKNLREELHYMSDENISSFIAGLSARKKGVAEVLRGEAKIDQKNFTAKFEMDLATAGAPFLSIRSAKVFYEIEVCSAKGSVRIGFGRSGFRSDAGSAQVPANAGYAQYLQATLQVGTKVVGVAGDRKGDIGTYLGSNQGTPPCNVLWQSDGRQWAVFWKDVEINSEIADVGYGVHSMLWKDIPGLGEWFEPGKMIGVAMDIEKGGLYVSVLGGDSDPAPRWFTVVDDLPLSAEAGSFFFPAISGQQGACVSYNFGFDPKARPLRISPPSPEYKSIAAFVSDGNQHTSDEASAVVVEFEDLRIGSTALLSDFDSMFRRQKDIPAEEFNEDHAYKNILNEILDEKVALQCKQNAVIELLREGATYKQLQVLRNAPADDFVEGTMLDPDCPYVWRSVLSGGLKNLENVFIPLRCSPSQVALVWEVFLGSGIVDKAALLDSHHFKLSDLMPKLELKKLGLHSLTYENAVLGLILAWNVLGGIKQKSGSIEPQPASVDLRGLEFSRKRSEELAQAVVYGCEQGCIVGVNDLVVKRQEDLNLKHCVMQSGSSDEDVELGKRLDVVGWRFVMHKVAEFANTSLDISGNNLGARGGKAIASALANLSGLKSFNLNSSNVGAEGGSAFANILSRLTSLETLTMGENELGHKGCKEIVNGLRGNTGLRTLELWDNAIGPQGGPALREGLSRLTFLNVLRLGGNPFGPDAAKDISESLVHLTSLRTLFIAFSGLSPEGGTALGGVLSHLTCLQTLGLGDNGFGPEGGRRIGDGLARVTSLRALNLSFNRLGAECRARLRAQLAHVGEFREDGGTWSGMNLSDTDAD